MLVLIEPDEWPAFLAAGQQFGFVARTEDALDFAGTSRVLLVMHQASRLRIDILLGAMPIEEEIVHGAAKVEIAGVAVPLPSPESIVLMKAIAQRARDVADIEGILEVHDHLDLDWIRERLTEFDRALCRCRQPAWA